jgi:hypothetical protein
LPTLYEAVEAVRARPADATDPTRPASGDGAA